MEAVGGFVTKDILNVDRLKFYLDVRIISKGSFSVATIVKLFIRDCLKF